MQIFGFNLIEVGVMVVGAITLYFFWRWWPRPRPYLPLPEPLPGMSLATRRLPPSDSDSMVLSIPKFSLHGPGLLAYMTRLPGLRVVSAKGDENDSSHYEGSFIYKERLYWMNAGLLGSSIGLRGYPPDERAFAEIERHVQTYSWSKSLLTLGTQLRICFLPGKPPLHKYRPASPDELRGGRPSASSKPTDGCEERSGK